MIAFTAQDKKALDLLYDPLAIFTAACLCFAVAFTPAMDNSTIFKWSLLYLPGLFGNYLTFPLLWNAGYDPTLAKTHPRKIHFLAASLVTGFVNWVTFVPMLTAIVAQYLPLNPEFDYKRELALLAVYTALAEAWFYAIHRACHANKTLFKLVHAHHHRITDPHVSNASYQHPVEMLLITMGTAWVGPFLLTGHAVTVGFHVGLVMALGNYGHSGESSIHDSHHRVPVGNYGFLHVADGVAQTRRVHVRKQLVKQVS